MLTINEITSATTIEIHIPFIPKILGSNKIIIIWNTKVLKKDIIADVNPSFNAVKNDEAKIFIQLIIYDIEYNLIAFVVNSDKATSYPTNILANPLANISASSVNIIDAIHNNFKLFLNNPFNSS